MISVVRIRALAGCLGTPEGLARVNGEMESLTHQLMEASAPISRDELTCTLSALNSLSATIRSMEQVVRAMMGDQHSRAVDCVG